MLGPMTVPGQKQYGDQIKQTFEQPLGPIFRFSILTRAMAHGDLVDAETARGGKNGHKAVHPTIQVNFAEYLLPVTLHSAIDIV